MVDSHALVGSCAQVGKRVHLSAAAQIGGVIEPVGALPVIVEDDVLVGGNTGFTKARSSKRGDCTHGADRSSPVYTSAWLNIKPEPASRWDRKRAVVVPGARSVAVVWAKSGAPAGDAGDRNHDDKTGTRTELGAWIR
jgi:2,3,4,5-tetrahydropyridine-2-carboxylate N-succinyltransferase